MSVCDYIDELEKESAASKLNGIVRNGKRRKTTKI